ncbi:hypothetical protein [Bdellovibrio sp. HCB337]|uniref:hypothetical protein n=1 Tax=Bdellovibrio sp. HCB337 TaxID=3394358 RepID=UPI0039A504B3
MKFLVMAFALAFSVPVFAFKNGAFYGGVGYFSQNSLNKTTSDVTGKASLFGTASYPLSMKYDFDLMSDWYGAARLHFTPVPRASAGDSAKTTMMHLSFPVGKNFASNWEWFVGPGVIRYETKGKGGIVTLNNGGSTADFALPGRTSTAQNVTLNTGVASNFGSSRIGFDLVTEGAFSEKRSMSLMFSYDYRFNGGGF